MARGFAWAAAALGPVLGLAALAGCAETGEPGSTQATRPAPRCFSVNNARNFRVVNSRTVNLRVGRDVYRLDMLGPCVDLAWSNRIALVSGGSSRLCTGNALGASIVLRGSSGRQRCPIQTITALTAEQVEALPARDRP